MNGQRKEGNIAAQIKGWGDTIECVLNVSLNWTTCPECNLESSSQNVCIILIQKKK